MLIFVHGMGFDQRQWKGIISYFERKNFSCSAINLREGLNLNKTHLHNYIEKVESIVTENDIVIGQSMGGLIVQKIAEITDIKAGIGICSAPPKDIKINVKPFIGISSLIYIPKFLFNKPFKPDFKLYKKILENYMAVGLDDEQIRQIYEGAVEESTIVIKELAFRKISVNEKKIRCPLLFIGMKDDRLIPPETIIQIAQMVIAIQKCFKMH